MAHLESLKIRHFRNISNSDLNFSPWVNVFLGNNAQGKTNLLEAILYLATSTTPRTNRHYDLIERGERTAYAGGVLREGDETTKLELGLERGSKRIKVDGTVLPRVQELYGRMRCVFFAPEDLEIVSGAPGERRRFLDMAISQLEPSHIEALQGYQRTIQQRNSVLRRIRERRGDPNESPELDVWEEPCAVLGAAVLERRWRMLREFGPLLSRCYESLAGHGLHVEYQGDVWGGDAEECRRELAERYFARRESDMESAGTTTGPHRDDIRFRVRDVALRQFGSQGERRSAALALRLAQADYMLEKTGRDPILLVDDVIYEMDPARQGAFLSALRRRGQVFFTVTDLSNLGDLADDAKVFRVAAGKVEEEGSGGETRDGERPPEPEVPLSGSEGT